MFQNMKKICSQRRRRRPLRGFESVEMMKIVSYSATSEQWAEWLKAPLKYASVGGSFELVGPLRVAAGGMGGSDWCKTTTRKHRHPYPQRTSLQGFETKIFALVSSEGTPVEWADWLRVPLEHAAARGNLTFVHALLAAGANGKAGWRGCRGRTLLDAAALGGNADVVSALVAAGAAMDVNVVPASSRRSALYTATFCGHEACARRLVVAGADVNFKDPVGRWNVLHRAIEGGLDELVTDLLVGGVDVDARQEHGGCTVVHYAASIGRSRSLSALLLRGADKDAVDTSGSTPLLLAAMKGHLAVVNTLLTAGADTNVCNTVAGAALHYAAFAGHAEVVSALLRNGADVHARTNNEHTPLILAAYHGFLSTVNALLAAGSRVDAVGNKGNSALMFAAYKGHLPVVEALLAADADTNIRSPGTRRAALYAAADEGHHGIVSALLRKGADKDIHADNESTPIWAAAKKGHLSIVDTLLAAGANTNIPNSWDQTVPLHRAAGEGHDEVACSLLRKGAEVNALDSRGMSPLAWAARGGHARVVKTLLAAGADLSTRSRYNLCSALDWAALMGKIDALEALIGAGAEVDGRSSGGETALHKAAKNDHAGAVVALIKAGADLELRTDRRNFTPLLESSGCFDFNAMIALLEHGAAVNVHDQTGETPLHRVCRGKHEGLESAVDLLLLQGADEKYLNQQGHAPADLLDVGTFWTFRKCSEEEREGARRLLSRASANRAWGRRCWLVMLRSRARDAAECGAVGGDKRSGAGAEQEEELGGAVSMLVGLASEGLFRTAVGFL